MNKRKAVSIIANFLSKFFLFPLKVHVKDAREILSFYSSKPAGKCYTKNKINIEYDLQIVIPAYNVEKYIKSCLLSAELLANSQYKVLIQIVDDGSTDNTSTIIDHFATMCTNDVEVVHQSNKGLSGARNRALEIIRGKYITFLDSDDYFCNSFRLDDCYMDIEGNDIVQCDMHIVDNIGNTIATKKNDYISGFAHGKFYYYTVLKNFNFPLGFWFEDTTVRFILSRMSNNTKILNTDLYCYRKNPSGITATATKNYKVIDSYWITELCLEELPNFGIKYDDTTYDNFLHQCIVNDVRVRKMPRKIRKAVFSLSCDLENRYFCNVHSTKYKEIESALKERNFGRFEWLSISNWYSW